MSNSGDDANGIRSDHLSVVFAHHDWNGPSSLSEDILMAVSDALDKDPLELEQFCRYFDSDALNSLFELREDGRPGAEACLSFNYEHCEIEVDSEGRIAVAYHEEPSTA